MRGKRQPTKTCACGKVVTGNAAQASHRRACDRRWLSWQEAYEQRKRQAES